MLFKTILVIITINLIKNDLTNFRNRTGIGYYIMLFNIVITAYSLSCLGQEKVKGPCGKKRAMYHLATCLPHKVEVTQWSFCCWTSSMKAVNTNFCILWFNPTGNRTQVYRFRSRRANHSITNRLNSFLSISVQGGNWGGRGSNA